MSTSNNLLQNISVYRDNFNHYGATIDDYREAFRQDCRHEDRHRLTVEHMLINELLKAYNDFF